MLGEPCIILSCTVDKTLTATSPMVVELDSWITSIIGCLRDTVNPNFFNPNGHYISTSFEKVHLFINDKILAHKLVKIIYCML